VRIAHFTAGTVGAGHLAHGVAVQRGLARAGFSGDFRIFGPPIDFPAAERFGYQPVPIDPLQVTNPFEAPDTELARVLADFAPELLVVDMFWAPVMYLLPLPGCVHWLLVRKAPDNWLEGNEYAPFDPSPYARIIAFEPAEHPHLTDHIEPVVICNPDECRPPDALRTLLAVPDDKRLAVVTHAGAAGELADLQTDEDVEDTVVARFDLRDAAAPFPAAEWLGGADRIYSAAGYNSFWEAKTLGYYDRTRFTAFGRRIDDQQWRLDACADYVPADNGADQLARMILAG